GRDRIARTAEDERRAAAAERERLARLDRDSLELDLDPEGAQRPADQVVGPHRHTARENEDVVAQAIFDHPPQRVLLVGCYPEIPRHNAGAARQGAQERAVAVADQTGTGRTLRLDELVAGRDDGE